MKQLLVGGLLAAACFGAQAEAEKPDYFTSQQLYNICSQPISHDACAFIILGIFQGIDIRGAIDGRDEDCIAFDGKTTNRDYLNMIVGYLASNKNMLQTPAATSVVMAVGTAECKSKLELLR